MSAEPDERTQPTCAAETPAPGAAASQPATKAPVGVADGAALAEVLASIRALVSAETAARLEGGGEGTVLMLTPEMRMNPEPGRSRTGAALAEGVENEDAPGHAPSLDEEGLRRMIAALVREELQGALGEQIGRNLRKLVRQEVRAALDQESPERG